LGLNRTTMSPEPRPGFLALRDRAYAFVTAHGPVSEDTLLAHVYGGPPPSPLRAQLSAPLLDDPRLDRRADGHWSLADNRPLPEPGQLSGLALTTLALAASGPNPRRGRVVHLCALHVHTGITLERFTALLDPSGRVP